MLRRRARGGAAQRGGLVALKRLAQRRLERGGGRLGVRRRERLLLARLAAQADELAQRPPERAAVRGVAAGRVKALPHQRVELPEAAAVNTEASAHQKAAPPPRALPPSPPAAAARQRLAA
jgi:hypothetical protein